MFHLKKKQNRKIFLKPGTTDMRKSINGLSLIVQEEMNLNAFSDSYFVFCNRNRRIIKILYWDCNGFCLWHKRLEKDRFPWPKEPGIKIELTGQQIRWLLSGIDHFNAYKELKYSAVC